MPYLLKYKNRRKLFCKILYFSSVDMCIFTLLLTKPLLISRYYCSTGLEKSQIKLSLKYSMSNSQEQENIHFYQLKKHFTKNKTKKHCDSILKHFKNSLVFPSLGRYTNESRHITAQGIILVQRPKYLDGLNTLFQSRTLILNARNY